MRALKLKALLASLVVLAAAGLGGTAAGTDRATSAKAGRLVTFGSCGELLDYAKSQAGRFVGPWGLAGRGVVRAGVPTPLSAAADATANKTAAEPVEGVDYSGTNVQEAGVDEPDLVKTNGKTLFALANGNLDAVDVRGTKPRMLDSLHLDQGYD